MFPNIQKACLGILLGAHKLYRRGDPRGFRLVLTKCDLRGSDLSYSDLRGSDLSYSDLRGSNLSGSNLSYSNLSGSNLRYSNLSGSNLRGSNLLKLAEDGAFVLYLTLEGKIGAGCRLFSTPEEALAHWNRADSRAIEFTKAP